MGTLRTLFAISVVLAHVHDGDMLVGARNAVQLFYIISGFLISYVLTESRIYSSVTNFYINRYLRLYPVYFVVSVLTIVAYSFAGGTIFFETYRQAPPLADAFLVFANLLLFFQDWVHFLAVEGGALTLSQNFHHSEVLLYRGLIVPQAWTIGVELSFYLVAPFVLARRRRIVALLCASLMIRAYLAATGLGFTDPWSYRFFPAELTFFLLGALAHQVLLPKYRRLLRGNFERVAVWATGFMITLTLAYSLIPVHDLVKA